MRQKSHNTRWKQYDATYAGNQDALAEAVASRLGAHDTKQKAASFAMTLQAIFAKRPTLLPSPGFVGLAKTHLMLGS